MCIICKVGGVYLEARRKQQHALDFSPLLSFVFLLVPLVLPFFCFCLQFFLRSLPFHLCLLPPPLFFFLPPPGYSLCFLSFFHVLSSSVLPVFFLPMLSLTLLLYPLSISSLSRSFFFFSLLLSLCFLSLSFPPLSRCSTSSGFYSQRMQPFSFARTE